uniref:Uncharacterized protein n=1 Tax=Pyramimonas orientalis virus TaxID=455367 RepID=A0A7L9AXR8_POV01|nr:hypothetical protein HWQ62_00283 [Pyramimonas orientalis virus]
MGILLDGSNNYLTTILDILIVFVLGFVLLFFANIMKSENRYVMMFTSFIVISVLIYNTVYVHHNVEQKKKESNMYNIMTFINIYVIILMILLSGMSLYITMDPKI